MVWQSHDPTYLVTSGPPILSGSSETLGEERGPECLTWTRGASSPPPDASKTLPWPRAPCPLLAGAGQGRAQSRDWLSFSILRWLVQSVGKTLRSLEERSSRQAGRDPHGEGETHTHPFLSSAPMAPPVRLPVESRTFPSHTLPAPCPSFLFRTCHCLTVHVCYLFAAHCLGALAECWLCPGRAWQRTSCLLYPRAQDGAHTQQVLSE